MKTLLAFAAALVLMMPGSSQAQLLPPNADGVTMGHVHLNVKDVDAQKKFWTEHFDAVPLKRDGLPGVKVPGMLILFRQRESTGGSQGTVLDHFGFKVRNIAEMLKSFRDAGVPVLSEFKGTEGFPNAYVMGPDDIKIELQEDTSLPVRAAVNHLHYYTADIPSIQAWYAKNFGATPRKRGAIDSADISGINLSFSPVRRGPARPGTKGRSLDHIGFEVKNLDAFCKRLEANGVKLDSEPRKIPNLGIEVAFLTDPYGTYIELTEGLDAY